MNYYFDSSPNSVVDHTTLNLCRLNCHIDTRLSSPVSKLDCGYLQLREKPVKFHRLNIVAVNMHLPIPALYIDFVNVAMVHKTNGTTSRQKSSF